MEKKKINIKNIIRSGAGIFAFSLLFITASCNQSGDSQTDYVNEIEAEENAIGQPDGEDHDGTPADVETQSDTTSESGSTYGTTH